jgi:ABC-type transporter Mla MlaB component
MSITITYADLGSARAAILRPAGMLDRSNYQNLIAQAWAVRDSHVQHLIVDLSDIEGVSTAGMVALYAVARLAQGAPPPDLEAGWAAIRALVEDRPITRHLAVVNPHPPVRQALGRTPFNEFLAVHNDLVGALAALTRRGNRSIEEPKNQMCSIYAS